jgi:hypothetical protein
MTPEYPIEMPAEYSYVDIQAAPLQQPDILCSMLRMGMRCENVANRIILYPTIDGCYHAIAICRMCLTDQHIPAEQRHSYWNG